MNAPRPSTIPAEFAQAASMLPGALQELLQAELASGNTIIDAGHSHPAPPAGAYVMLANPVTMRARESFGAIKFYERNSSHYSGEFADTNRMFFVLEAPHPDDAMVDMDAVRETMSASYEAAQAVAQTERDTLKRFDESREMDYDRWREGTGYDLEALLSLSERTREEVERSFIPAKDWRDVEALVALNTPRGAAALRDALTSDNVRLRMAVLRRAPQLADEETRLESVLMAIAHAAPMDGLAETLDAAEEFHPPAVVEALFNGLLDRPGDIAYHFATSLAVIYKKLDSRFDWSMRPQLLLFNTTDAEARRTAFLSLYDLLSKSRKFTNPTIDKLAATLRMPA